MFISSPPNHEVLSTEVKNWLENQRSYAERLWPKIYLSNKCFWRKVEDNEKRRESAVWSLVFGTCIFLWIRSKYDHRFGLRHPGFLLMKRLGQRSCYCHSPFALHLAHCRLPLYFLQSFSASIIYNWPCILWVSVFSVFLAFAFSIRKRLCLFLHTNTIKASKNTYPLLRLVHS